MKRTHKCDNCMFIWKTTDMVDEEKFCPRCGHSAPVILEESGLRNLPDSETISIRQKSAEETISPITKIPIEEKSPFEG